MATNEPSDLSPESDVGQGAATPERASNAPSVPIGLWLVLASYILFYPLVALIYLSGLIDPNGTPSKAVVLAVFTLTFSVLALLGVYVGLGFRELRWRLIAAFYGVVYLDSMCLLIIHTGEANLQGGQPELAIAGPMFFLIFAVSVIGLAIVLMSVGQCLSATLHLINDGERQGETGQIQFSLRTLMGFVLVAGMLLAAARSCHSYNLPILFPVLVGFTWLIVTLLTVWAGLGSGKPMPRIAVVSIIALCLNLVPAFALPVPQLWLLLVAFFGVFAVVVPLLFVRSMGYRFSYRPL